MTTTVHHRKAERDRLEAQIRKDLESHCPLWPDLGSAAAAFERVTGPRSKDVVRNILNGERGKNLTRRQLGRKIHYDRAGLAPIIAGYFLEESHVLSWGEMADPTFSGNAPRGEKPAV